MLPSCSARPNLVRKRRDDFNALLVLEVGKSWVEADADTAEAIDFLDFYGREALRYANPPALVPVPGEDNRLAYIPLGVGIVIPPWNFALRHHGGHDDRRGGRRQYRRARSLRAIRR